jgi:dCMP deaminase
MGDVRAQFHKGEQLELTTAIHAEALAIATAAKRGMTTLGAEILVTDFPCPVCARLIGAVGIKTVYYRRGYSLMDGEEILRAFGVKIIKV